MLSRVAGYIWFPSRSRAAKDSVAKRQRANDVASKSSAGAQSAPATPAPPQRHRAPAAAPVAAEPSVGFEVSLERRRCEEKEFIKSNDSAEAELWCLVDVRWLHEWKQFVSKACDPPGPIDNSRLLGSDGRPTRPGLQPVSDYRGVNADIWDFWYRRYGGGPAIRRRQLDLYAPAYEDELAANGPMTCPPPPPPPPLPAPPPPLATASPVPAHALAAPIAAPVTVPFQVSTPMPPTSSGAAWADVTPDSVSTASSGRRSKSTTASGASSTTASSSRVHSVKVAPCCDKCNGPHATSKCPHFPRPRENHIDASCSLGKSGKTAEDDYERAPIIRHAVVHPQPPDGSCLFHSLSFGLDDQSTAASLRRDITSYIATNPDITIADTALKDWIRYDSGGGARNYAESMRGDTWGGGIEMAALTKMRRVNVHVYEKCGMDSFRRISAFEHPEAEKTVNVLYQGRMHYDAITF